MSHCAHRFSPLSALSLLVSGSLVLAGIGGCAGARASRGAAEPDSAPAEFDPSVALGMPKPKSEEQMRAEATQELSFEEDGDAGPTDEIKRQPKRKPLPRFRLYGEGPGPNP